MDETEGENYLDRLQGILRQEALVTLAMNTTKYKPSIIELVLDFGAEGAKYTLSKN